MKRLPIDLSLKTVTTKVSTQAWDRAQMLKQRHGCRLSDIVSVALLYIDDAQLSEILEEQNKAIEALPKSVRGLMSNLDKLTDVEREMLRELLK